MVDDTVGQWQKKTGSMYPCRRWSFWTLLLRCFHSSFSVVVDFAAINKVMKLRVWQASWFLWLFPNEIERSCVIKTADDEVRLFSDLFGNCVADDGNDGVWQTDVLAPWGQCRWLLNLIASGARVPSDTTYVLDGLSRSVLWRDSFFNPFKPSGVKWLHYKVFKAILV